MNPYRGVENNFYCIKINGVGDPARQSVADNLTYRLHDTRHKEGKNYNRALIRNRRTKVKILSKNAENPKVEKAKSSDA